MSKEGQELIETGRESDERPDDVVKTTTHNYCKEHDLWYGYGDDCPRCESQNSESSK